MYITTKKATEYYFITTNNLQKKMLPTDVCCETVENQLRID